jgi:hypothetical protein
MKSKLKSGATLVAKTSKVKFIVTTVGVHGCLLSAPDGETKYVTMLDLERDFDVKPDAESLKC